MPYRAASGASASAVSSLCPCFNFGAPGNGFTVCGATPARDSAVLGFQARTAIAEATSIYLRYDGEVGGGIDNHALNLGVRMTW